MELLEEREGAVPVPTGVRFALVEQDLFVSSEMASKVREE
jgi:hypothetical protein